MKKNSSPMSSPTIIACSASKFISFRAALKKSFDGFPTMTAVFSVANSSRAVKLKMRNSCYNRHRDQPKF